jgi:outer membrane protein assembly factor BamB
VDGRAVFALLCAFVVGSATSAVSAPQTPMTPQPPTATGARDARDCQRLPLRVAALLKGKTACQQATPVDAPVAGTDHPPALTGCGLPEDTNPRCPTAVDDDDPGSPYTVQAETSPDGRTAYVVGSSGGRANILVAYDVSTGRRLRTTALRTPAGTYPRDAALSSDGRHLVVGGSSSRGAVAYVVDVRSGALRWTHQLVAPGFFHGVNAVGVDGDRVLLALGQKEAKGTYVDDWRVSAHSLRTGARLWTHLVGKADGVDEYPTDLVTLRGSRVVVVGTQQADSSRSDYDAVTRTYDTRTGRLVATEVFGGAEGTPQVEESWWAAAASPDRRRAAAVGTSGDGTGPGAGIVALHSGSGRAVWQRAVTSDVDTQAYGVAQTADRVLVAAGASLVPPLGYLAPVYGTSSSLLVALDARSGDEAWRTTTGRGTNTWTDTIEVSPDGRTAYAVGNSTPVFASAYQATPVATVAQRVPADGYVVAVRTDDGSVSWTSRWSASEEGTSYTYLYALAAGTNGIVVSGFSERRSTRYLGSSYVTASQPHPLVVRYDP